MDRTLPDGNCSRQDQPVFYLLVFDWQNPDMDRASEKNEQEVAARRHRLHEWIAERHDGTLGWRASLPPHAGIPYIATTWHRLVKQITFWC